MIQHQNAPNSIMFGTDTKWSEIDKNGIHLGFSPSTRMSYGIGLSQEKFEWSAYDMGDDTKALRQKKISGQVGKPGNWLQLVVTPDTVRHQN